jgi:uncharacterized protein YdaU (DUF1376 family)
MVDMELYSMPFNIKAWLSSPSVKMMTPAERGGYIQLLCYCWKMNGLPDDDGKLAALSDLGEDWKKGSGAKLRKCFRKRRGKLYSERLENERKRVIEQIEKSRRGGLSSAKARKEKQLEQKGGGKGGCDQVASKGQGGLDLGCNLNPTNQNHNIGLNLNHTKAKLTTCAYTRSSGGELIWFGVDGKEIILNDFCRERDMAMMKTLRERLRPVNGTAKVIEDIAADVMRHYLLATGEEGIFDEMAAAAARLVADEKIKNPMGAFVQMAKRRVGYAPRKNKPRKV